MRMAFVIFLVLFIEVLFMGYARADVGWAQKPRSVIGTKIPGEIRVMVIDTGISHHTKLVDWVQYDQTTNYIDNHGHGTHVTGIIVYGNKIRPISSFGTREVNYTDTVCKKVKIYACKYFDPTHRGNDNLAATVTCIDYATEHKMDVINYSGGGVEPNEAEYKAYVRYINSGGVVFTVAGNEHSNLGVVPYYPASYSILPDEIPKIDETLPIAWQKDLLKLYKSIKPLKNFYVVMGLDHNGRSLRSSNVSPKAWGENGEAIFSTLPNDNYGLMTGSSQSAPELLHKELKLKCQEVF